MVSLRRHTHFRLCAGRTSLPRFCDIRTALNSSHAKPKSVHRMPLNVSNDVNQPETGLSRRFLPMQCWLCLLLQMWEVSQDTLVYRGCTLRLPCQKSPVKERAQAPKCLLLSLHRA